jgi:hypothetical protein
VLSILQRHPGMNFVFFSAHFPAFNQDFIHHLSRFGANVLGIGDCHYDALSDHLKSSLTDYYQVSDQDNYEEVLKAVGYFTFKYGKIDRFESLNEHWLELEARIRTDFNIEGVKSDAVQDFRRKSRMKNFFLKSGIKMIPYLDKLTGPKLKAFIKENGYPIIVKPDKGSGANLTFKISTDAELRDFLSNKPEGVEFIAEVFIDGIIVTYDGLVSREGNILFESSTVYEQSIMDVVNNDDHVHYVTLPRVSDETRQAGQRIIKSFNAREKFYHLELFKSRKNGEIIALEVNMRPPGAWMTDAINFSYDMDIYREWANMVVNNLVDGPFTGKYHTAYASRKHHKNYLYDHGSVIDQINGHLVKHSPIEPIFSRAMGNYAYQFRTTLLEDVKKIIDLIQREAHG